MFATLAMVNGRLTPIVVVALSGDTVDGGMVAVKVAVDVPTGSFPLKVSHVIVPVPLFAFVSADASEVGTVQLYDVADVLSTMVYDVELEPKV